MRIFVNKGAVSQHQANKDIAPKSARDIYDTKIKQGTSQLKDPWYHSRIDMKDVRKNLKQTNRDNDRTRPETLTAETQNMMWKRAKRLKDSFSVGMLSHEELHPVKQFHRLGKIECVVDEQRLTALGSVHRNSAWEKRNANDLREYKNIMRHLCPDDPTATDYEKFRPKKRGIR